jgi:shikimate dehydrogenase
MQAGDALPMSRDLVERSALIAECVLAPETTELLRLAAASGRAIHTGIRMLEAQMGLVLDFMTEAV